jgi:O-acetyl-ADP-ribose deacetylase (regulator of RNase III)
LKLAEQHQIRSIAFPNISTGIYRFPKDLAAQIATNAVKSFESINIEKVIFVCFDNDNFRLYKEELSGCL